MKFLIYFSIFTSNLFISADRNTWRNHVRLRRKLRLKGQTLQQRDSSDIVLEANRQLAEVELFEGDIVRDEFVDLVYGFDKVSKSGQFVDDTMRSSDDDRGISDDILPTDDMLDNLSKERTILYSECPTSLRHKRAATAGTSRLWAEGVVYYEFDHSISPDKLVVIKSAMTHWEANTCLRFQPRQSERDYLSFYNGAGCFTTVGKDSMKSRVQFINTIIMF